MGGSCGKPSRPRRFSRPPSSDRPPQQPASTPRSPSAPRSAESPALMPVTGPHPSSLGTSTSVLRDGASPSQAASRPPYGDPAPACHRHRGSQTLFSLTPAHSGLCPGSRSAPPALPRVEPQPLSLGAPGPIPSPPGPSKPRVLASFPPTFSPCLVPLSLCWQTPSWPCAQEPLCRPSATRHAGVHSVPRPFFTPPGPARPPMCAPCLVSPL